MKLEYLAKGKRSKVYIGVLNGKKVVVKKGKRARIEAKWLKILNKYKIGPKFVSVSKDKLIYEFIDGERILDFKGDIKIIIKKVLDKCRVLDKLKINKKEMQNPYKHILIKNKKVKMIDFERCYYSDKPKNVTQFCQFIRNKLLKVNNEKFKKILQEYKGKQNEKNYFKILDFLKL